MIETKTRKVRTAEVKAQVALQALSAPKPTAVRREPFHGSRRIVVFLGKAGHSVHRKLTRANACLDLAQPRCLSDPTTSPKKDH